MARLAIIAVCLLQIALAASDEGHYSYTVVGPGTIHSERKYNVAVTAHHNDGPSKIIVGIEGVSYNETKPVELQSGETKVVEFDVPHLEEGSYNLTTEGISGMPFKNRTALDMEVFKPHMKIQTDKGHYKPGDTVNYRVFFLDENLRPGEPSKDTVIWFEDAKRNRIAEIKNFEVVKGVYTGKFEISKFPVLGSWMIFARVGRGWHGATAYFDVSKYVLPKYTVKVEATDAVSVKDGDVQVVVRANYTYGKPVNAKVTTLLEVSTYYERQNKRDKFGEPPVLIKTADMVNGKAKFDFNVKEWESYLPDKKTYYYMTITATVEENFTGVKINGTDGGRCYAYRYAMSCTDSYRCRNFLPDTEQDVPVSVKYIDDTPLSDSKSVVKLTYTEVIEKEYYYGTDYATIPTPVNANRTFVFESYLNASSIAVFKVKLPDLEEYEHFRHYFEMHVQYKDEQQSVWSTYQKREPKTLPKPVEEPKEWFKVEAKNNKEEKWYYRATYNLGEEATISVNSSVPLSYFIYNIIARANILSSVRVNLPDKPKTYEFKIPVTFPMANYAKIYVYYVDEAGDFHYAENEFHVVFDYQNPIEITAEKQVKPGQDVALHIKTTPNSFVGLLAIDQSVLLLGRNNDIEPRSFQWTLGSFATHTPWQGGYSYYPGSQSGVVTLTNANYFYNRTRPSYEPVMYSSIERSGISPHVALAGLPGTPVSDDAPQEMDSVQPSGGFKTGANSGSNSGSNIAVRKDFSETWIFADIESTETEEFTWTKKIPDTITSWIVSGFSLHPEKGLGITQNKTTITTFQPFFIAIRLPYSVKRGEVINVPALVFNYLDKDLDVVITLDNTDGEYDFVEVSNDIINEPKRVKTVRVAAQASFGASFLIRPKIVGSIMLKFTATSPIAGDAIHKTLKVEPEGVTQYANRAYFVNLKKQPTFKETFELALPKEVVPDSEHIEFSVVGDLLGPLIQNLDRLLRLPMGCGEQTMSAMVPNYFTLRYLESINRLTPALENKIKRNLESGYQNILRYRHNDGAFSSFGPAIEKEKPRNGSTWLTAYVLRSLHQMKDVIKVDESIFTKGFSFLKSHQALNGTFLETGGYFYYNQKAHVSLTASVLLAFAEVESNKEALHLFGFADTVDQAYKYLLENFEKTESLHSKALIVYALHLAKHELAAQYAATVKSLAKSEGDRMWWSDVKETPDTWWRWGSSGDVETTSYMLLTLLDMETVTVDEVLPILKWLVAQRNSYGGFYSTQDTVVGLQALIKFAKKSGYEPAVMDIDYAAKGGRAKNDVVKVTDDNGLLLQIFELPEKTRTVEFEAKGKGTSLVQISYQYNIVEKEPQPSFKIKTLINHDTPLFKLELDVCVDYAGVGDSSNMAVLEISLPSGYVADSDGFDQIKILERVRLIETKNAESVIVVYFDHLRKDETHCLPIGAFKSYAVAMQKPASIVLYDYYDVSRKATTYYEVVSKMCDICEGDEECVKACKH